MLYWGQIPPTRNVEDKLSSDKTSAKKKKKMTKSSFGVKALKSTFTYENANSFLNEIIYNHKKQVQFMNSKLSKGK